MRSPFLVLKLNFQNYISFRNQNCIQKGCCYKKKIIIRMMIEKKMLHDDDDDDGKVCCLSKCTKEENFLMRAI